MANEPRTGFYAGVHYLVEDGKAWYRGKDVGSVLGIADIESAEWLHRPEDDGVKSYIPSVELATIVDGIVGDYIETMRDVWVTTWYEDLDFHVESGGDVLPATASGSFGDYIFDVAHGAAECEREKSAERIEGLKSRISEVRHVADSMGRALQCLQDGVTYLDGFRSGALMASGDVPGMGGIQSLFVDLRGVEDEMSRIHSQLEDIANGGEGK